MVKAYLRGAAAFAAMLTVMGGSVEAAPCGNNSAGFENWKQVFAQEAAARGIKPKAISAPMTTTYSTGTIRADRNQKASNCRSTIHGQARGGRHRARGER